jgi:hypothetical protein
VAFHGTTAADPVDEVTISVVVGIVMQPLGGAGVGAAVRVERQQTERTSLGLEITGGYLEADDEKLYLFTVRGYGKGTPRTHDWVAVTYGAGFSVLTTGMIALQLHGGGAIAYPNQYAVPYLSTGIAASLPILDGRPFGHLSDRPQHGAWRANRRDRVAGAIPFNFTPTSGTPQKLKSEVYWYGSLGLVVPLGDTENALSLDFGAAEALRDGAPFFGLSLADTQH